MTILKIIKRKLTFNFLRVESLLVTLFYIIFFLGGEIYFQKFSPKIDGPQNGIIRHQYPSDHSTFSVKSSYFYKEGIYPFIYNTALFYFSTDFSQFYAGNYKTTWVDIIFKNLIYLTHVSYTAREVDNLAWQYPTDFAILGTTEMNETLTIFRNTDPNYLNTLEPVVIPVKPGIYQSIRIEQFDLSRELFVIRYLDLFESVCVPISNCYENHLKISCDLPLKYFQTSPFFIIDLSLPS